MSEAFFDTNILLYLLSGDDPRRAISVELLANGGVISVQVLNEFVAVARGKYALDRARVGRWIGAFLRG